MANKPDPKTLTTTVTDGPSSGSGSTSSFYGLGGDAQAQLFNVAGMPGLPVKADANGQASGADIIKAFLAMGQSPDPQVRAMQAAIQHALYYGNYYGEKDRPSFGGEMQGQDAEALSRALTQLAATNQAPGVAGGSATGKVKTMAVSQFLTSQATLGSQGGPNAPGAAVAQVYNVRAPNSANVASAYEQVAQQLLGHRPDAADTAAFVNSYTQQYVSNEKQNYQAQYDAAVQKAQVKAQTTGASTYLPSSGGPPTAPIGNPGTVVHPGGTAAAAQLGLGAADTTDTLPDLTDSVQSLQDVINAQAQAQQPAGPGFITAGTNVPEDVGTAAENFARNQHPSEAAAGDLNSTFGTFLSLIGAHMSGV